MSRKRINISLLGHDDVEMFLISRRKRNGKRKLHQSLSKYRAAMGHYSRESGQDQNFCFKSSSLYREISKFLMGVKKDDAKQRASGAIESSAKRALPIVIFRRLGAEMLAYVGDTDDLTKAAIFAQAFLKLQWNLACRSENIAGKCSGMCFKHMGVAGDSVTIKYHRSKCDQTGEKNVNPRHIYSNPHDPEICIFLGLGVYLLCDTLGAGSNSNQIFPGSEQAKRFGVVLERFCSHNEVKVALSLAGLSKTCIGSHSIRKGVITYTLTGTTSGPAPDAVGRRAPR